ncbi:MAG TPA: hypothetical protein VF796_19565 [Humisphaera sp.]
MRLAPRPSLLAAAVSLLFAAAAPAADGPDLLRPATKPAATRPATSRPAVPPSPRLAPWRHGVKLAPVAPAGADEHSIHAYYVTTPESPDGKHVLYYASTAADGQAGEVRVVERSTGRTTVLAAGIKTEDAHRAACQQWVSGGRRVAFHNALPSGEWVVECVDVTTGERRVLARNRQLGFGSPAGDVVPLYGPHWDANALRDLELLNVATGEVTKTPVTAAAVRAAYPEQVSAKFGDRPISVFFPCLSPDGTRVFFKLATPAGGDARSKQASDRECLLAYDLAASRFLLMQAKWGHPAWHPNSRDVLNVGGVLTHTDTGKTERLPNTPSLPGSHPSFGPAGTLFASDAVATPWDKPTTWWVAGVGDPVTGDFAVVHAAENGRGAKSWRPSHPHPVFSPDGRRLYFNVSADGRTRLWVAEAGE